MAAIPAWPSVVALPGTPTTMTNQACTDLGSDIHQITLASRRVIDIATAVSVEDDGGVVDEDEYTIDYFFGKVIFSTTPTGDVDVTAKFIPIQEVATAKKYVINAKQETADSTVFKAARNRTAILTLEDADGSLELLEALHTDYDTGKNINDLLETPVKVLLSIAFGTSGAMFRAWVYLLSGTLDGPTDGQIVSSVGWSLSAADDSTLDPDSHAGFGFSFG